MSRQQHMDTLDQKRLQLADDAERLADKAQNLKGELLEEAKVAADRAKSDTKTTVRELSHDAKNIVAGVKNDTKTMAREGVRSAAQTTSEALNPKRIARENPLLAFFSAVAAGFLIARMMPSRRFAGGGGGPYATPYGTPGSGGFASRTDVP